MGKGVLDMWGDVRLPLKGIVLRDVWPVGNGEDSTIHELLPDGGLHQVVCLQVYGGCGLVQYQHLDMEYFCLI